MRVKIIRFITMLAMFTLFLSLAGIEGVDGNIQWCMVYVMLISGGWLSLVSYANRNYNL